jgi:type II secretory pathway pseudopilin PulG
MFSIFLAPSRPPAPQNTKGGFGLVELLISISIIVIVVAVILTRQSTFNSAVVLRGQAYEVALTLREVQLNAVSVSGDTGTFREVQGVHFNSGATSDHTFRVFRDDDNDGYYDGASEEFGQQGFLDPRFEIRAVRAVGGDTLDGDEVSVVFVRPNFDARFFDGPGDSGEVSATGIEIDIARRDATGTGPGELRTVEVTATGQISVQ